MVETNTAHWRVFGDVRRAFHWWCLDGVAEQSAVQGPSSKDDLDAWVADNSLPTELGEQYAMTDNAFATFIRSKLGSSVQFLGDVPGRKFVMQKMIEGVADMDADYTVFLMDIENDPEAMTTFFDFLESLTCMANTLLQ